MKKSSSFISFLWFLFIAENQIVSGDDYIVGGDYVTDTDEYPFIAWLTNGCTASLYTKNAILTATHCFYKTATGKLKDKGCGEAVFNVINSKQWNGQEIRRKIVKVVRYSFDLALAFLDEPVDRPTVKLHRDPLLERGDKVKAVGYGMRGYKKGWGPLKDIDLTVTKYFNITKRWGNEEVEWYAIGTEIGPNNEGACAGDSGGPLLVKMEGSKEWRLVGTLRGAGYNCEEDKISSRHPDEMWNTIKYSEKAFLGKENCP